LPPPDGVLHRIRVTERRFSTVLALAALLAPTTAHPQSRAHPSTPPRSASSTAPADAHGAASIRAHDFRNDVFHVDAMHADIALHDGRWSGHVSGNGGDADTCSIESIAYGDLDGDGVEEAAVWVRFVAGGGTSRDENAVDVFALRNGRAVPIARALEGSRAEGGVYDVEIRDGRLRVRTFGTQHGADDREWVDTHVYRLAANGLERERDIEHASFRLRTEAGPIRLRLGPQFPGGAVVAGDCASGAQSAPVVVQWHASAHDRFVVETRAVAGSIVVRDANGGVLANGTAPGSLSFVSRARGELTATLTCTADSAFSVTLRPLDARR
jgi:hypothetical protein